VAGIHGNEPAGVLGAQRVIPSLNGGDDHIRGEFLALAGNREALSRRSRFVDEDLNRIWQSSRIQTLLQREPGSTEEKELQELVGELQAASAGARGPVFVIDLHTTSSHGGAFATVSDTLPNRAFAMRIPTPLVLGLEELVEGTMLGYMGSKGYVVAGFESGQHDDPGSVDRAEAALWIALSAAGLIKEEKFPEVGQSRRLLAEGTRELPRAVEMRYRRGLQPGDGFRMRPGYRNFQLVAEGEVVASDADGDIRAPETARMLMPLYQSQGEDGFFIVRDFSRLWLTLSWLLRFLRLDRAVHLLPGVSRHPTRPDTLVVDRRVARWYALQLFHLLGFRRHLEEEDRLVVVRRSHDR
jgi:succinylglutamate desuccinylase